MLQPSPVLPPLLDERFGLGHRLRDATSPLHTDLVQLLHVGLTINPIVRHIDTGLLPSFPQLGLGGDYRRQQAELITAVDIQGLSEWQNLASVRLRQHRAYRTLGEFLREAEHWIDYHDQHRPHEGLQQQSPDQFARNHNLPMAPSLPLFGYW